MLSTSKAYEKTISVNATAQDTYSALTTGYENWWTSTGGAKFETVGDQIKFTFQPQVSNWTFEAKTLIPEKAVILECVDAYHVLLDQPDARNDEWLGSRLIFRIESQGATTDIHFTHEGLLPQLDCYEICEQGWDHFFAHSLKNYLDQKSGAPFLETNT